MDDTTLIPEPFGPLQGIRVVSTGTLIAQPFACSLMADMGAEVIHVERPGVGDAWRIVGIRLETLDGSPPIATNWIQERRNIFCVTLDLARPESHDLFFRLIRRADIWMENSKGGTYARWGLDDDTVLRQNPKLVIVHVSGYGQSGDPGYASRASYDIVGQAFGGSMYQTGSPDPEPPMRAAPWVGDYTSALFALWSALAGVIHAMKSGRGQAIDLAQYEAIHRTLGGTMVEYFMRGIVRERSGNRAQGFQPLDAFRASDGWVVLAALTDVYDHLLRVIGLDPVEAKWQNARFDLESIEGIEFDAILRGWVNERTVAECVRLMNEARVPCSPIMSSRDAAADPQYRARNTHMEWDDPLAGPVKGVGIVPKFSVTPGKVFRGSVSMGHDNQRVYRDLLGMTLVEIDRLRNAKII